MATKPKKKPNIPDVVFGQGLEREVALRLFTGDHTRSDRGLYYRTVWWQMTRQKALEVFYRQCAFCGTNKNLNVHHKPAGYRRLFCTLPLWAGHPPFKLGISTHDVLRTQVFTVDRFALYSRKDGIA